MTRFDYIPGRDNGNPDKENELAHLINDGAPRAIACTLADEYSGYMCAMSRYNDVPECVTVEWCKNFAQETEALTGEKVCRVETRQGQKRTVYKVSEDCLTIYEKNLPVYRNKAGSVCRDTIAIIES